MAEKKRSKVTKRSTKLPKNDDCKNCGALCCRDLTMMITKPRTKAEIDELKWYVRFDTVNIFIRNYKWYLIIKGKCIYLTRNNLCKIYKQRPIKCRIYQPPDCERFGDYYDILISNPDELEDHLNNA